jgi:hypothetical protein
LCRPPGAFERMIYSIAGSISVLDVAQWLKLERRRGETGWVAVRLPGRGWAAMGYRVRVEGETDA